MSAGSNSMVKTSETSEGLDHQLSLRYYSHYVWTKELLPLLKNARKLRQDARVMSVLGAGFGFRISTDDSGLDKARASTIKPLSGVMLSFAAVQGMLLSPGYNDAMVAYFAAQNPEIAFTHIHPGLVNTSAVHLDFGWLLAPLAWFLQFIFLFRAISHDQCVEYVLYAPFSGERDVFLRKPHGDVVSSYAFDSPANFDDTSPIAHKK
ncbi:hypothetical protein B0H10DRAFT_2437590 [Mycena sp. CBHHK59/15]|nr:hypothetical protein B0H10DRAFT_2437590 [Mycena sp. CBHHK59/15]